MSVKRYNLDVDSDGGWEIGDAYPITVEDPDGDYVKAEYYDVLAAENAALRKDAERLQWLVDNPRGAQIVVDGRTQDCVFWGISGHPRATLREAIDAAMGASHE